MEIGKIISDLKKAIPRAKARGKKISMSVEYAEALVKILEIAKQQGVVLTRLARLGKARRRNGKKK